jgi:hypothetical protein
VFGVMKASRFEISRGVAIGAIQDAGVIGPDVYALNAVTNRSAARGPAFISG